MLPRYFLVTNLVWLAAAATATADERSPWRAVPAPTVATRPAIGTWITTVLPASRARPALTTASLPSTPTPVAPPVTGDGMSGIASFYWQDQMTASGERFDRRALTAAHRTLPFGTRVRVTHAATGKSVVVRINDRGPFKAGRVVDVSEAAAEVLGMTGAGLATVRLEVVAP